MKPKLTTSAQFAIHFCQFLNEAGEPTQALPDFAEPDTLLHLYQQMLLVRALDKKAVNLQRTGKMGTYPSSLGQEAVTVGAGSALQKNDVYVPYYRDQGALIQRGVDPSDILRYWGGDERGSDFQHNSEDLPICVPIATQTLHAAGIAYAFKYRQQPRVVVTMIGDGGTSKGDFYEAMNVAGAWNLPVVFIINNNQWAISVAREAQTHCQTLAQKAIAAGIDGIQVDGNDIIAMRYVTQQAITQARNEHRPSVIEAITYRLCDHTTADDASRYVPNEQRLAAEKKEPLIRFEKFLRAQHYLTDAKQMQITNTVNLEIEKATQHYLNSDKYHHTDIIDFMYQDMPASLLDQRDDIDEGSHD